MRKLLNRILNFFRRLFGIKSKSSVSSASSPVKEVVSRSFHKVPRLIVPPDVYGAQYVANRRYY